MSNAGAKHEAILAKLNQIDTGAGTMTKITKNADGTVSLVYSGKNHTFNPTGGKIILNIRLTPSGQLDVKSESCSTFFGTKTQCAGRRKSRRSKSKRRMTKRRR
jgi:hypothetical protein